MVREKEGETVTPRCRVDTRRGTGMVGVPEHRYRSLFPLPKEVNVSRLHFFSFLFFYGSVVMSLTVPTNTNSRLLRSRK